MRAGLRSAGAAAILLLLTACGGVPVLPSLEPEPRASLELARTPFFPQEDYQCGPAALATVLNAAGIETRPATLVDQVYMPARRGSLQLELLAATRRAGRIPYVIEPSLTALVAELDAGRPVLVLQNQGLSFLPVWHYAVVIGIDLQHDRIILRSGVERRQLSSTRSFLRTWNLSKNWGMVVLRPGELPAHADQRRYLKAIARAESVLSPEARLSAYRAALTRWPMNTTAQFGLAHAFHAAGDLTAAEDAYEALLNHEPRNAAAYNNLAQVLSDLGCHAQARRAARRALEIARTDSPGLIGPIGETLGAIPPLLPDGAECPGQPSIGSGR